MWDLQQWLEALFGHWQHLVGAAGTGAGILLAIVLVQRLFKRRISWQQAVVIFLFCFGADAGYLAWHDEYRLNRRSVSHPLSQAKANYSARSAPDDGNGGPGGS